MSYESLSYLTVIRNVERGVKTRTLIIRALRRGCESIREISEATGMKYQTILRHLRNMEREGVILRRSGNPCKWILTGKGQQNLPLSR